MDREYVYSNGEREISLMDLFFYLLSKWRILLLAVFAGILVGLGAYLLQSGQEDQALENMISEEYAVSPEVLASMEQALSYRLMYFQQRAYHQESYIIQMNPQAVYTGVLEYYVSSEDHTGLISERCQNLINEQALMVELQKILDTEKDPQYIKELLGCSIAVNNAVSGTEDVPSYSIITYTVAFMDENVCAAMLQALQEKAEMQLEECREKYGTFDYEVLSDFVETRKNESYASIQKSSMDSLNNYAAGYSKLENELGSRDRIYYNTIYLPNGLKNAVRNGLQKTEEIEKLLESLERSEAQDISEVPSEFSAKTAVKWTLTGIIVMIILWGGCFVLKYLFDRHVKSVRELQNIYGLRLLGNVVLSGEKRNIIDRWIDRVARNCQMPSDTAEYMNHMIALMGSAHILLCGAVHDAEVQQAFSGMVFESFVHQSQDALQKAKASDGIILMVKKNETYYQEVRREVEICNLQGIHILGTVVIV